MYAMTLKKFSPEKLTEIYMVLWNIMVRENIDIFKNVILTSVIVVNKNKRSYIES